MGDHGVTVLGIPIPSSSRLFLGLVALHVGAGLTCVVSGVVAMLAPKRRGRHPTAGTVYFLSLAVVFVSMGMLSILRWPVDNHLLVLGLVSFAAAVVGRSAHRRQRPGWARLHIAAMGTSYIVLLTAFYVDNGPNLPVWRALPRMAYWVGPGLVGLPIVLRAWLVHPLVRASRAKEAPRGTT